MTPYSARDDTAQVTTPGEARERVRELIGPATCRQLWFMLLDVNGRQLPLLIPVGGIPLCPEPGSIAPIAARLNDVLSVEAPGGSAILTLERPGSAHVTAPDQAWARELESSFGAVMRITGMFVAHDEGVCRLRG